MRIRNAFLVLIAVTTVASFTFFDVAENVTADDNRAVDNVDAKQEQVEETGTITGRIVLPPEVPDWFRGGAMSPKDAIVVVEGMYRGPRMERPANYREMTTDQRKAWFAEFQKTDAYKEYDQKRREAYESRPISKFPVAADGTFTVKGLKLARYNVIPVIPHPAAKGKELASQSWGSAFRQIVLSEERKSMNVGKMELKLNNVTMPGDVTPSWTASNYNGEQIQSSDFRGKFLILDFWATWCSPCIAEIPNLEKIHKELGGDRLEIIGLSIDEKLELPSDFLENRPTSYPQGYLGAWNATEKTTQAFGIQSVPSIWLIAPDGRVVARDLAGDKIGVAVRSALNH